MNILDIIIIIPVVWLAYRGFSRGLIIEIATLAALILGIYFSVHFSDVVGSYLIKWFDLNTKYLHIIAFIVTFAGVVILVYIIGRILEKFINMIALGFINKLLGGVFGILKAVLLLSVLFFIINRFDTNQKLLTPKIKEGSLLYEHVAKVVPTIIPFLDIEKFEKKIPSFKDDEEVTA